MVDERQRRLSRPGVGTLPLVLLPAALAALILGTIGGAARIELAVASIAPKPSIALHGPLLVFGFIGVLIAAERAIVLRRSWGNSSRSGWSANALGCTSLDAVSGLRARLPSRGYGGYR